MKDLIHWNRLLGLSRILLKIQYIQEQEILVVLKILNKRRLK